MHKQTKGRINKILESGLDGIDRNMSARLKLSQKYAKSKKTDIPLDTPSAATPSAATQATEKTLWNDPEINKTIEMMDPETRYLYSQIGQKLFDKATSEDPQTEVFSAAAQIKLMLRDGLDPKELTEEEKTVLVAAIGPDEALEEYGIEIKNELKISSLPQNEQVDVSNSVR